MERERLRFAVFGEAGAGKTTLGMTFPKPLVIDTDGGLISVTVERPGQALGEAFVPAGHEDLEGLFWWIKEHSEDYETIFIDSGDELIFTLMGELLDDGAEYDRSKKKEDHPTMRYVPEQREYFANQRQMHAFLQSLRKLNKHIVISFGVRDKLGEKRGIDVAPGLATIINRWASVMGELVVIEAEGKEDQRALITKLSSGRVAKSRFRALLPYVLEPTFDGMWSSIEESYKKGEAAA